MSKASLKINSDNSYHPNAEWGYIFGNIEDQLDLWGYLTFDIDWINNSETLMFLIDALGNKTIEVNIPNLVSKKDGSIIQDVEDKKLRVDVGRIISKDEGNVVIQGDDGKIFVPGSNVSANLTLSNVETFANAVAPVSDNLLKVDYPSTKLEVLWEDIASLLDKYLMCYDQLIFEEVRDGANTWECTDAEFLRELQPKYKTPDYRFDVYGFTTWHDGKDGQWLFHGKVSLTTMENHDFVVMEHDNFRNGETSKNYLSGGVFYYHSGSYSDNKNNQVQQWPTFEGLRWADQVPGSSHVTHPFYCYKLQIWKVAKERPSMKKVV